LPREQILGKNNYELSPRELADVNSESDNYVFDTGETDLSDDKVLWHGETRVASTKKSLYRDAATGEKFIVGTIRDVTESALAGEERARLVSTLEQRSTQLQTAAQVSQAANSILDPNTLIQQTVELVRERFDLYYVGLFLVDDTGEWTGEPGQWAVLRAATGQAGRAQLEGGHRLQVGDNSMIGSCVAHARARISLDVNRESARFVNPLLPDTRSEMALPLISRDQVIGAMTIQSNEREAFSNEDVSALQAMANQLANAIQNANLFKQTQEQLADLTTIQDATAKLTAALSFEEAMDALLPHVARAVEADRVSLFVIDGGQLTRTGTFPIRAGDEHLIGQNHALADYPLTQKVVETRQPLALLSDDPELQDYARQAFKTLGVAASATIPLVGREGVLGTLAVSVNQPGRSFSDNDIRLIQTLADQATVAFERIRLIEQTQARADELTKLFDVSQQLSSAFLRPEEIAATIAHQLVGMRDLECSISLLDPDGDTLNVLVDVYVDDRGQITHEEELEAFRLSDFPATARVMNTLQPLIVQSDDESADFAELAYMRQHDVETLAILPLVSKGQAIGVMELEWWQKYSIAPEQRNLALTLANQAAVALENARLFEQTQAALSETEELAQELTVLNELGQALTARLNVEQVLQEAYREASRLVDTSNFFIALYDLEKDEIAFTFDVTESETDRQITVISASKGITGYIVRHRTSVLIEDDLPGRLSEMGIDLVGEPALSWIGVPLLLGTQVLGVMGAQSYSTPNAWDEHDLDVMTAIASQTAIAIQNARLFEESVARAEELASLNLIADTVSRSVETEDLLGKTLDQTATVLGFDAGLISLTNPETGVLSLACHQGLPETMVRNLKQQGMGGTLCEYVIQTGETIGLGNMREESPIDVTGLLRSGFHAYTGTILAHQNNTFGTICLFHCDQRDISLPQLSLLETIGRQIGVGIQNARLFEETQTRAHREQILREILAAINESQDLVENLPSITDHLRELLPIDMMTLISYTPGESEFAPLAVSAHPEHSPSVQRGGRTPLKGTATGWVITNKKPWLDTDLRQDPPFPSDRSILAKGMVSRLLVPLEVGDQVIGSLNLASTQPESYTEAHVPILNQVADQMALALERIRLLEETQIALAEVEATHSRYLRREWEATLTGRADRIWGYTDGPAGLNPDDTFWTPEVEQAVASGELVAIREVGDGGEPPQRSALAIPIKLRDQIIGVLDFYDAERTWTDEDKILVQALADQVSLALENARLFEQTQRSASRERLTGEIVGKIRAAGDVQAILETAAQELGRALGISRARVRLGPPYEGTDTLDGSETSLLSSQWRLGDSSHAPIHKIGDNGSET
jgi:GAF domain-containing protein